MKGRYSISSKKQHQLYGLIQNDIVIARVKIQQLGDDKILKQVDDILSPLSMHLGDKAIDIFKIKEKI